MDAFTNLVSDAFTNLYYGWMLLQIMVDKFGK